MLKQLRMVLAVALLLVLSGCSRLAPSDPPLADAGIRLDGGVLSVVVPSCAQAVEHVELSTSPQAPNPRLLWSGKISGGSGKLVPLKEASGHFSPSEELQLEVFTSNQMFVANWPGSSSTAFPKDPGEVMVQDRSVALAAFAADVAACASDDR